MNQVRFSIPLPRTALTVRTVERVELPIGEPVELFVQFPGQATWIRATRAQADQALLLGIPVRADRVTSKECVREAAA